MTAHSGGGGGGSSGLSTSSSAAATVLEFSVWVTNVDNKVVVEELLKLFNYCGPVKSIIFKKLNPDYKDALIIFSDKVSQDTSLLLDQVILSSKPIRVYKDIPKDMIDMNVITRLAQQPTTTTSTTSTSSSPPQASPSHKATT